MSFIIEKSRELVTALEENFINGMRLFKNIEGVEWVAEEGHEYFFTGCSASWLNGVLFTRENHARLYSFVPEVLRWFWERGQPALWRIGSWTGEPEVLVELLEAERVKKQSTSPVMLIDLETTRPDASSQMDIRFLEQATLSDWLCPFQVCFGLNDSDLCLFEQYMQKTLSGAAHGFESFVGMAGGKVVCCASLSFSTSVPALYNIGVLPECRGRGFGTEMVGFCLQRVQQKGFSCAGLFSSKDGFGIYEKLGFREVAAVDQYALYTRRG
jgi:ribosomal protein S18 acetylase RimI-like enzyme